MTQRAPVPLLTAENADAREAMHAIVSSRCLSWKEDEPGYPKAVAELAWKIADAMAAERGRRQHGRRP
jgi:hypothetical protein